MRPHPKRSRRIGAAGYIPKSREVRQLREEMQRTQAEFGALVYRSAETVGKWEHDERLCPADTWEFLCLLHAYPQVERARRLWLEGRADVPLG